MTAGIPVTGARGRQTSAARAGKNSSVPFRLHGHLHIFHVCRHHHFPVFMTGSAHTFRALLYVLLVTALITSALCVSGCLGTPGTAAAGSANATAPAWQVDHAVIVVNNLTEAKTRFAAAGFSVVTGGEHGGNATGNALVPFADGSYLELFAPVDPAMAAQMKALVASGNFDAAMQRENAMDSRFMRHLADGPGPEDFAISYPGLNLSAAQDSAGQQGITLAGPIAMSRTRPDGVVAQWQVDVPVSGDTAAVPFLIEDNTPRSYRVPSGADAVQPNNVTGIRSVIIGTADPANVTRWYDTVLAGVQKSTNASATTYALNGSTIVVRGIPGTTQDGITEIVLAQGTGGELVLDNSTWE